MPLAPQARSFTSTQLEWWFELLRGKNRAVSKDTWNLVSAVATTVPILQANRPLCGSSSTLRKTSTRNSRTTMSSLPGPR